MTPISETIYTNNFIKIKQLSKHSESLLITLQIYIIDYQLFTYYYSILMRYNLHFVDA